MVGGNEIVVEGNDHGWQDDMCHLQLEVSELVRVAEFSLVLVSLGNGFDLCLDLDRNVSQGSGALLRVYRILRRPSLWLHHHRDRHICLQDAMLAEICFEKVNFGSDSPALLSWSAISGTPRPDLEEAVSGYCQ
jgi:hypothetical protein